MVGVLMILELGVGTVTKFGHQTTRQRAFRLTRARISRADWTFGKAGISGVL